MLPFVDVVRAALELGFAPVVAIYLLYERSKVMTAFGNDISNLSERVVKVEVALNLIMNSMGIYDAYQEAILRMKDKEK